MGPQPLMTSGLKRPASIKDTLAQGPIPDGVTSFLVRPPSEVTWIIPSSVPIQRRRISWLEGAIVWMTPHCRGLKHWKRD